MKPLPPIKRRAGEMLPLMDMVFLLLVVFIFMVVQMRPDFGVSVDLPDVARELADPTQARRTVTVSLKANGELFVNETASARQDLVARIRQAAPGAAEQDLSIILRADRKAAYGEMVDVFTLLRQNRMRQVVFDVDLVDEKAEAAASPRL